MSDKKDTKICSSEIEVLPRNANDFIEQQLDDRISKIEDFLSADVIAFSGGLLFGVDDFLRDAIEQKCSKEPKHNKLVVILTTSGGYIEVVHRIVDTMRRYYELVEFIVPNYAYSAGTVLVMSGDTIYMDYYSRLGPIDPQVENQNGRSVPALGYLEKYNELISKAQKKQITTAEVQLLIQGFDQAELHQYEQARELSITLLKEWLVKYKFKNWKVTQTRQMNVTKEMKTDRASAIASELNQTKRWHVHGYGISMDVLINDLNLLIDDFGKDQKFSNMIRAYHELLSDYMIKRNTNAVIHYAGHYSQIM